MAEFEFDVLRSDADLEALAPEWLDLGSASGTRSPFAHPGWITQWFRCFVPDADDRLVVAARREGQLVAVAPFYRRVYGVGPLRGRCLQLVGGSAGSEDRLTEMSEILVARDGWRKTMQALVHHLALDHADVYDWIGLTLSPEQGWFDDRWLPATWHRQGGLAVHKETQTFVILPLPDRWEELRLKRNMKEAIRRSKNRLATIEPAPVVDFVSGSELRGAVAEVQQLHRLRAELRGHAMHNDYFAQKQTRRFAVDAVDALAQTGHACVALLRVNGTPLAGRVVMQANNSLFLSFSGADPEAWHMGASTFLIVEAIRRSIDQGDNLVNLSKYPDQAKLRWSEQLSFQNEFVAVAPSRKSRRVFSAFWQIRAHRQIARRRRLVTGLGDLD